MLQITRGQPFGQKDETTQTCGCNPGKFQWLHHDLTVNDDGGFSVWASRWLVRWYVAGWPARNPRLTMSQISFISQALLYVHVCFIYVAHKIVHELHAAVLEKKIMLQGILTWNWNKQVCHSVVDQSSHLYSTPVSITLKRSVVCGNSYLGCFFRP